MIQVSLRHLYRGFDLSSESRVAVPASKQSIGYNLPNSGSAHRTTSFMVGAGPPRLIFGYDFDGLGERDYLAALRNQFLFPHGAGCTYKRSTLLTAVLPDCDAGRYLSNAAYLTTANFVSHALVPTPLVRS